MIVNKALVVGYLVKDPEAYEKVTKFTLAVTRDFKNSNNEYESDFLRCVAFGQTAENIKKYCHKGDILGVDGQITTSKYEKDGKMLYNTEITANKVRFISKKGNTTPKQENASNAPENVSKLNDDVFEQFGNQIEIDDIGF